jgi:hypothetical protein
VADLTNSTRQVLKATHTPIAFDPTTGTQPSRAHEKAAMVRALQLQPGEVDAVQGQQAAQGGGTPLSPDIGTALRSFEPQTVPALIPKAATLADVPMQTLLDFGQSVLTHRKSTLQGLQGSPPTASLGQSAPDAPNAAGASAPTSQALASGARPSAVAAVPPAPGPAPTTGAAPSAAAGPISAAVVAVSSAQLASAVNLVTSAQAAVDAFANAVKISPIGMLNLERLEMSPAGIERGELLSTIPLAPGETTSVVEHEWTVTSQDYSSIVTDSLENFSETGVTEKTDLAEASTSETKHDQQMGLSASLSGSYGFVTFATNAQFQDALSTDQTEKDSRDHSKEVTQKASSRVRQERKVTIQTVSTSGQEQTSTRTLTNPSTTDSMRIDYYSMMRKWQVNLLQYGLRLTYDIGIPEPGASLREPLATLAQLKQQSSAGFVFDMPYSDIDESNYQTLAGQYGAELPAPPATTNVQTVGGPMTGLTGDADSGKYHFNQASFDVPPGYAVSSVRVDYTEDNPDNVAQTVLHVLGTPMGSLFLPRTPNNLATDKSNDSRDLTAEFGFMAGVTGHQEITFMSQWVGAAAVTFTITADVTDAELEQWRAQVWSALHDAAQNTYYANQQSVTAQITLLEDDIAGTDTLTLRQEELDEVMKGILRWLLGPGFQFMPADVVQLFLNQGFDLSHGIAFTGNTLNLDSSQWMAMFQYQEMVKFLNEAIEWENLIYFVYPYFWDVPPAWDFVRTLTHPDATRQQFLRAGSARVVLTVRQGYEDAFAAFIDRGDFGDVLPPDHPYITIGQEVAAYAQTNYPGIPPANPASDYRPLLSPLQRKAWQDMQGIIGLLDTYYQNNNDIYPTTAQGLAALSQLGTVPAADPWGNAYVYRSPGAYNDYELSSLGADGAAGGDGDNADITSWAPASLIGQWYEYTPTHGTDIQINTAAPDMA